MSRVEAQALRDRKEGAGLVYEYDGSRWALEDGKAGRSGACPRYMNGN